MYIQILRNLNERPTIKSFQIGVLHFDENHKNDFEGAFIAKLEKLQEGVA